MLQRHLPSFAAAFALVASAGPAFAQTLAFPFVSDDLPGDVRIVTGNHAGGIQAEGKDLGAMRYLGSNRWSELTATAPVDPAQIQNVHHVIYGRSFRAMADGEVIACWRNAPENARPGELHPDFTSVHRRIVGAGNHLVVRHDDGTIALYAHAIPGSIPQALCPINDVLTPGDVGPDGANPNIDHQTYVPAGISPDTPSGRFFTRPRVSRGQVLGRVGNSGSSSGPHLHIHIEDVSGSVSVPDPMVFERGLWTPSLAFREADITRWTSFSGQQLPRGDIFIWPPQQLAGEFASFALPAAEYQALFDHLANSGFWLESIDGYALNGQPFLNTVWRPGQGAWLSYSLVDAAGFQRVMDDALRAGFTPFQFDSLLVGGQTRFNAIFRQNLPGAIQARYNLSQAQHDEFFAQMMRDGLRPISVSVTSVGGQRFYTELYRTADTGSFELRSAIEASQYPAIADQNAAAGRRPSYVNAYVHNGQSFYSVVFTQRPAGARRDVQGLTRAQLQSEYASALAAGLPTRGVSSFDGATGEPRFIAFWRK